MLVSIYLAGFVPVIDTVLANLQLCDAMFCQHHSHHFEGEMFNNGLRDEPGDDEGAFCYSGEHHCEITEAVVPSKFLSKIFYSF